jgi:hypothetical protein
MPSRRRRSKKNSSKARRSKRTTRVKRGKGPGTKQLIPIAVALKEMYDTIYAHTHVNSFVNKRIEKDPNYGTPEYLVTQIEEFNTRIRQPLLTSNYGQKFLKGPTMSRLLGVKPVDSTSIMLTELASKQITTAEELDSALKLAGEIFENIVEKVERIKDADKNSSHEDFRRFKNREKGGEYFPFYYSYGIYKSNEEDLREPSLSEMPIMFDS